MSKVRRGNVKSRHLTPKNNEPVFIHSLWRDGSTYLFSVFRRSKAGYYCYQEPVHEIALLSKENPENLLQFTGEKMDALRHPSLKQSYFFELYQLAEFWREVITKPIIYDEYFGGAANGNEGLIKYLKTLITHAKGRPVIQECRTSCRISVLKQSLQGTHIYLWRNPWDQWWSYKCTDYFDITSQLILNAPNHPDVIDRLRREIDFEEFHDEDISKEFAHFNLNRLTAENSYFIFYLIWCLGLFEGMDNADLMLNIDTLSTQPNYREEVKNQLLQWGITDLDFTDCQVPQTYYGTEDRAFFVMQEERVHALLLLSGYPLATLNQLKVLRQINEPDLWSYPLDTIPAEKMLSASVDARAIVLREETQSVDRFASVNEQHTQKLKFLEQRNVEQLSAIEQQAAQEQAAQAQQHREQAQALQQAQAEREQAFTQQIQIKQEALIRVEQDRRAREQVLSEQTVQARQELENLLRTLVQREQEVAAQLLAVQQQAAQEQAAQAQQHREQAQALQQEQTEREQTLTQALHAKQEQLHSLGQDWQQQTTRLNNEVLVLESEKQALDHAQQIQALYFDAELNSKIAEYNRQLEACAALELQLKHELEAELQTSLQLKQSLSQVQQSLAETHASLSWRLTAPFRRLACVRAPKKYAVSASASALNMADDLSHLGMPPLQELHLTPFSHDLIEALMLNPEPLAALHPTSLDELLSWHDQQFVNAAYKLLLGREADAEGLRYYLSRLRCGYAKTHLLTQLSLSKEAKAYAKAHKKAGLASLPGLPKAIKNYRRGQYLLIGGLFRWLNGAESNHPAERKLRAIEQQIILLSDESKSRFNQLESALYGLHHLVVQQHSGLQDLVLQQNQSINAALDNMSALTSDRLTIQPVQLPETAPPLPKQSVEPEGLKQLSPRARNIYFQLKAASVNNARRAV